jgi:hypothetical protein
MTDDHWSKAAPHGATPGTPRLQKFKKNEIIRAIQAVGLDPREFDLAEDESEAWIKHKLSGALFTIGGGPAKYVGHHQWGDWPAWPYEACSWEAVMRSASSWLDELKRDLETPDLWAELQSESALLVAESNEDADNTPFSSSEREDIAARLHAFAEEAEQVYALSEVQMSYLNARLDYLVAAADRLGRIDWRNALLGAIIAFLLTAAIPPDSARDIFYMLLRAIIHLWGLGFPDLPRG